MRTRAERRGTKNICGRRIEELRKAQGLKQVDMLEALAVQGIEMSAPVLSKIEGQHRTLGDAELAAIANVLDVSADVLLGRVEKPV